MSEMIKRLEKVKSFDKRVEMISDNTTPLSLDESDKCLDLIIEKAKYPQHFAEIVACFANLPLSNKRERLRNLAEKADQHPTQAGSAAWVLAKLGYTDDAISLWRLMSDKFIDSHPNLGAQMLAYGLILDGAESEAKARIEEHKSNNHDVNETLYQQPKLENQVYLRKLL
jgi:hypothetical protein